MKSSPFRSAPKHEWIKYLLKNVFVVSENDNHISSINKYLFTRKEWMSPMVSVSDTTLSGGAVYTVCIYVKPFSLTNGKLHKEPKYLNWNKDRTWWQYTQCALMLQMLQYVKANLIKSNLFCLLQKWEKTTKNLILKNNKILSLL